MALTSVAAVALVLWAWSDWTWWVLLPLVVALVLFRLALGLVPRARRDCAGRWAAVAVAVVVAVYLASQVPVSGLGVAAGVGGLVCAAQLGTTRPGWVRWAAVAVSAVLVAGCGLAAWLTWLGDRDRRAADERTARDYRVAEMRPDQPLAVLHHIVKAIHYDDPLLVCFLFTDNGERDLADAVHATSCEAAISTLHNQITGRGYGNATTTDITREQGGQPASVSGCRMYVVDGPLEHQAPPGPRLGTFRLERDSRFPNSGYLITSYTPCGESSPDDPTTSATPHRSYRPTPHPSPASSLARSPPTTPPSATTSPRKGPPRSVQPPAPALAPPPSTLFANKSPTQTPTPTQTARPSPPPPRGQRSMPAPSPGPSTAKAPSRPLDPN